MSRIDAPVDRRALGRAFEGLAREFLEARGLHHLAGNWQCRLGELDLVMLHGEVLVFVEVRARRAGNTVGAVESIDAGKRRRLASAARHWLMLNPAHAALPARFDVIAFDDLRSGAEPVWLQDAFDVAPR